MFTKATKYKRPARVEIQGLAGSGKSYTALSLGKAFAGPDGKVAVVDTEHGRSELYSDLFNFDVVKLDVFAPSAYIDCLTAAEKAGYSVVILDSLSHAWIGRGGVLDIANGVFSGWKKATPEHNRLIEAILSSPLHVISTCRMKTGYSVEKDAQGKQVVNKLGLEVVQRDGIEYEFDWILEMDSSHNGKILKTPLPSIDGLVLPKPGEDLANIILNFLNSGADAPAKAAPVPTPAPARRLV